MARSWDLSQTSVPYVFERREYTYERVAGFIKRLISISPHQIVGDFLVETFFVVTIWLEITL